MDFDVAEHSHRRRNPLSGQWVLLAPPHRAKRPWQGQQEVASDEQAGLRPQVLQQRP